MEKVLSTPELVNNIFWNIEAKHTKSIAKGLCNWVQVNKLFRDACAPDAKAVWWQLFQNFIARMRKCRSFSQYREQRINVVYSWCEFAYQYDDTHPRRFVELLFKVYHNVKKHEKLALAFEYDFEEYSSSIYGFLSLKEVEALWEDQPLWTQAVYKLFYDRDANLLDGGVKFRDLDFRPVGEEDEDDEDDYDDAY